MKKYVYLLIVFALILSSIPTTVKAYRIENFNDDDFFNEAHVGWNLGNSLDPYIDWDGNVNMSMETRWGNPKVSQELIDYVYDKGFNVIRIPVTWFCHTYKDENNNYIIYDEWMNRVKEVVDYAYNKGMYVIINSHHDDKFLYAGVDSKSEYNQVKKVARGFWSQIATAFKDYDEHLLFEAYNELDNRKDSFAFGSYAAGQVNELNQIFVDAVRQTGGNNKYRLLIISPLVMQNSTEAINAVTVPNDVLDHKIILSVHMYSGLEDELIDSKFQQISNDAAKLGLRVMITEFGTTNSYKPAEHRAIAESNYVARAYEHGIISVRWDNGANDFKIFNRQDLSASNEELISALVNPTKYTNPNGHTTLNQYDQFYYKRLTSTGEFDEVNHPEWWGVWVNKELIEIPDDHDVVSMSVFNETQAGLLNEHGIHFFDKNKQHLISSTSNYPGYDGVKFEVPPGAKYFRYLIYNAKINTSQEFVQEALANGKFSFSYGSYQVGSLVGEKIKWHSKEVIDNYEPVPTQSNEPVPAQNNEPVPTKIDEQAITQNEEKQVQKNEESTIMKNVVKPSEKNENYTPVINKETTSIGQEKITPNMKNNQENSNSTKATNESKTGSINNISLDNFRNKPVAKIAFIAGMAIILEIILYTPKYDKKNYELQKIRF